MHGLNFRVRDESLLSKTNIFPNQAHISIHMLPLRNLSIPYM